MSNETISTLFIAGLFAVLAYWLGRHLGAAAQRDLWSRHMERCNDYRAAVDDLDRWCGHHSPHARLIARHLKAHGEGEGYNGGTPHADEVCDVSGLREQLRRLDAAPSQPEPGAEQS